MSIFDFLSIFDSITPIIETGKDIAYFAEGGGSTRGISINVGCLREAKNILKERGFRVVSTSQAAFDKEGILIVSCKDGNELNKIMDCLSSRGIDSWV